MIILIMITIIIIGSGVNHILVFSLHWFIKIQNVNTSSRLTMTILGVLITISTFSALIMCNIPALCEWSDPVEGEITFMEESRWFFFFLLLLLFSYFGWFVFDFTEDNQDTQMKCKIFSYMFGFSGSNSLQHWTPAWLCSVFLWTKWKKM